MIVFSSVATGEWDSMCPPSPNPSPAGSWKSPKSEEKKMEGMGVSDHLGQRTYVEICILVTKNISKLNQIQIMCQILIFNYLTTLQTNTQNNLGFSDALPAAHALLLNTQSCAWFGSCSQGSFRAGTHRNVVPVLFLMTGTPFRSFSAYSCKI